MAIVLGSISVNQVLHNRNSGRDARVLYIAPDHSYLYWIDLVKPAGIPRKESLSEVELQILAGDLYTVEDTWLPPTKSTGKGEKRREQCWEMLGDVLGKEPAIYEKDGRAKLLQDLAKEKDIAISNLYPLLKRFWQYGKVKDAFLPADEKKGGRGKSRLVKKNPGHAPGEKATCSKVLTEEDWAIFERYIKKSYLNKQGNTLQDVYREIIRKEYSDIVTDENGMEQIVSWGMGRAPTYRQFWNWYSNHRDRNKETVKRKGESALNLQERAITGKADYGVQGPGAQYQIDATIADVYLVSRFNRVNIIGRPVVYLVKDTFSRMITGLYVGLEGPSWMGMAMALYNSFTDKVDFCHKYGLEITEDQWPCHHLPFALIGDRGELESSHGERLANRLGIQVDNTPPYRGDLKPIVERHFRALNDTVVHRLPGNVKPDLSQRGGKDYRLDAALDLEQFTRIIIYDVLTYNKVTLESFEPSAEMMKAGVELTPLSLWNWGIQNYSGALRVVDEETCRLTLMPEGQCEITREGIKFNKLYYTCDKAVRGQWFENARRDGPYKLRVSYDPRDVHAIYVWGDGETRPEKAILLNWEQKFDGKSSEECEYEMEVIDALKGKRAKQDKDALLTADHFVDSVLAEAKAMKADAAGRSKSERLSGIKINRKQEKEAQRAKESFVSEENVPDVKIEAETEKTESAESSSQDNRPKRKMTELEKLIWGIEDE